jgi:uncharacterized membrane protein
MKWFTQSKLHWFFEAGIVVKAVDSAIEIALGILFFLIAPGTIDRAIYFFMGDELTEQPRDFIWRTLLHQWIGVSPEAQALWASLFLWHGIVKVILVIGLSREKLWIFPFAGAAFGLFALYQMYQIALSFSLFLTLLTIVDIIFIFLIVREYQYQRRLRMPIS